MTIPIRILVIDVMQRKHAGACETCFIDLDADEYAPFKHAILEGSPTGQTACHKKLVNLVVNNRSKDILMCSTEAKGDKKPLFEQAIEDVKADALAIISRAYDAIPGKLAILGASLFGEQVIELPNGTQMVRAFAQFERSNVGNKEPDLVVGKFEWLR